MPYIINTPKNINFLKKQANNKVDYKDRIEAVSVLSEYKCKQSIDILWRRMISDSIYDIQCQAFRSLQNFGEDVHLPKKKRGPFLSKINSKFYHIKKDLGDDFSILEFKKRFLIKYPEAYDFYTYEEKDFDKWIESVLQSSTAI